MKPPITQILHEWMLDRRITSKVAKELGEPVTTLSARLNPGISSAKLSADALVPLFHAIRRLGYGEELDNITTEFLVNLRGEQTRHLRAAKEADLVTELFYIYSALGKISAIAYGVADGGTDEELMKLEGMLRSEVLTRVYRIMEHLQLRRADLAKGTPRKRQRKSPK